MLFIFNFLSFFVILSLHCVASQLYEGAKCIGENDGINGTCVPIQQCLSVVKDLKQRKHPQICSFKGRDPIICCTDCDLVNETVIRSTIIDKNGYYVLKTGRKANDKCLEYISSLNYSCPSQAGLLRQMDAYSRGKQCYFYGRPFVIAAVGGTDASKGEYPHMALLGYGDDINSAQWLCGGSVISHKYILTAAHCIGSNTLGPVKYVALGILKRTDPPETWQRYNVKRIIQHPQYKPPSKYHDIALLELTTKIIFSNIILPACLDTLEYSFASNARATGWGALGPHKSLADTLQVVSLTQYTDEECAAAYPTHRNLLNGYDRVTQSCYGDKNQITDTCEGDSGGPLQVSSSHGFCIHQIVGVTSYGRPCGVLGGAGMYTRVPHYISWIENIVWP